MAISDVEDRYGLSRSQARDCFFMLVHDGYIERNTVRQSRVFNWSDADISIRLDLWAEIIGQSVQEIVRQGDIETQNLVDLAAPLTDKSEESFAQFYSFHRALFMMLAEPKRSIIVQYCTRLFSACFYRVLWAGSGSAGSDLFEQRDALVSKWSEYSGEELGEKAKSLVMTRKSEILEYLAYLRNNDRNKEARYVVHSKVREVMLDGNEPPVGLEGKVNAGILLNLG